ncbi:uncharacterized protein METZ01_LOCUS97277 [marine metagenome]|uniref:Uncharacterized protein n=1 Tax=marine metagenome TaxID=408172 RepID=A0A381VXS5_9ZZZZ
MGHINPSCSQILSAFVLGPVLVHNRNLTQHHHLSVMAIKDLLILTEKIYSRNPLDHCYAQDIYLFVGTNSDENQTEQIPVGS